MLETAEVLGVYQQYIWVGCVQRSQPVDQGIRYHPIAIVRYNDRITTRIDLIEAGQQLLLVGRRIVMEIFVIETHDILTISQDAQFMESACLLIFDQPAIIDAALTQDCAQETSSAIASHKPQQDYLCIERVQI